MALAQNSSADCEKQLKEKKINKGSLFIALSVKDSALAKKWEEALPDAQKEFPDLVMKKPEDMHITLYYIGAWKVADIDKLKEIIRSKSTNPLKIHATFLPEVMGSQDRLVALKMNHFPDEWKTEVGATIKALNLAKLRKPDQFDDNIQPHITLAETKTFPPTAHEKEELKRFIDWGFKRLRFEKIPMTLDQAAPLTFFLAGASHSDGGRSYISIPEFLREFCKD